MKGFSLIETLIAIAILVTVGTLGLVSYRFFTQKADLQTTGQQIISTLRLARDRTLASDEASRYGVHFDSNQYVLFKGSTYSTSDPDNETHAISSILEIYDINLAGGNSQVIFDRVRGTTTNFGAISLRLTNEPTNYQTINILSSGQAHPAGAVAPTDSRLTDSRHLHFDPMGWSIQGATTLSLYFSDTPDVQENITMADYFNAGQSEFDWQGTIDVNGDDQTVRVHTHALDSLNTTLCIHRDRTVNSKALTVHIDGQEIVAYAADGTPTVGSSGGTMIEQ